jgi:hypothetical protein
MLAAPRCGATLALFRTGWTLPDPRDDEESIRTKRAQVPYRVLPMRAGNALASWHDVE